MLLGVHALNNIEGLLHDNSPTTPGRLASGNSSVSFRIKKNANKLAEGAVSEPFLPSGDQARKGGFAILPEQPPTAGRFTHEIPAEIKSFLGCLGRKTVRQLGNFKELGTWPDKTKQEILAHPKTAGKMSMR